MQLETFAGPEALASGAARHIAEVIAHGSARADLGLAGGSTPAATYSALTREDVDWSNVDAWLSDERWVHHASEDSNGAMAQASIIDRVAGLTLHRPGFSENMDPEVAAADYDREIRSFTVGEPGLVLLGMGTDGHVASLFPGSDALEDRDDQRWFVANFVPQLDTWRLTVTPHLLQIARNVVVIVSGYAKAEVLAEAVERPTGRYPIELLHDAAGEVTILADAAAGSRLSGQTN